MQQQLLEIKALLAPYADETRVALSVLVILAAAWLLRRLVMRVLRRFFDSVSSRAPTIEEQRRIDTVNRVLRHAVSLLIIVVSMMLVLNQVGISIAPILGAAGVVGIAVGFGAQSLVKDVFSGFFLLIENQIRVGDVVEIAGKSGTVEELTLRRTKLRSYDGSVHFISNGLITTVTNMSTEFAFAVCDVGVAYKENIEHVFEVMRRTAAGLRADEAFSLKMLSDLEIAGVDQLAESAVMIKARIKTPPLSQWAVRREYMKRLKAAFDEEGISIPFPHRTLIIEGGAPAAAGPASPTTTAETRA